MIASSSRPMREHWMIWALLAIFIGVGMVKYWNADAEDLASSYVGCRLIAEGHSAALFDYDSDNFAALGGSKTWEHTAAEGNFHGFLHPYVQTPLWGYGLRPLCMHTSFAAFSRIFLLLVMACFAATIWLIARFWAPSLLHPLPIALVLLCFWFSQPFGYAMFLMQTHALFFFLAVASLILAERDKPVAAGLLLACAAAVKLTPGVLVIYWLITRRWKAAASTIAWSAALILLTVMAVGTPLVRAYFADLHRISRVLLVSQNNQSFAAWAMGRFYSADDISDVDIFPLPSALRLGSAALLIAFTVAGGWIDRRRRGLSGVMAPARVPIGATMALVAVTVFAPIAWTHYSVILVAPAMALVEESRRLRAWWIAALTFSITILNFRPLATDVIDMDVGSLSLLRGQFYAGVLCLVGIAAVAWYRRRHNELAPF